MMNNTKKGQERSRPGSYLSAFFFCLLILPIIFTSVQAQSVYVKASINRNKILIGEPIRLNLEATIPAGQTAGWFGLDTIPHFDFIEKGKIDTTEETGGTTYRQVVLITSFDSGRWVLPAFALDQGGRSYLTDSIAVSVAFSNFDASQPYHDIKDILFVKAAEQRYIVWSIIALTVLSLLILIYLLRKPVPKQHKTVQKFRGSLTPFEQAIKALDELRARKLPEGGQVKAYYTGLNDILRDFVTQKTGFSVLEKTNDELVLQVKQSGMPNEAFIAMAQTLRMSDAVKFAKFVPGMEDNETSFNVLKKSIETLNNL